jgi:hypothetical protein
LSLLCPGANPDLTLGTPSALGGGIAYRVSFTRAATNMATLFRARDYGNARATLKAAQVWRDPACVGRAPDIERRLFGVLINVVTGA